MTGVGESSNNVYLIDFGLARLFRSSTTHIHIPQVTGLPVIGTTRYTSINSHLRYTQSRRDDLESLTYTIIYLVRSSLPWQGITLPSKDNKAINQVVLAKKQTTNVYTLCEGLPTPFIDFVRHVQSLGFDNKPDYCYLHSVLVQCSGTPAPSSVMA